MKILNKYRSRIDLMASILDAASKKKNDSITQVTYGGLLSHRQITSHLQPLINVKSEMQEKIEAHIQNSRLVSKTLRYFLLCLCSILRYLNFSYNHLAYIHSKTIDLLSSDELFADAAIFTTFRILWLSKFTSITTVITSHCNLFYKMNLNN